MWAEGNSPQRNGEPLKTLRILIADDHDLMRRGVKALLESHEGWEVCGEAKTGREAVAKAEQLKARHPGPGYRHAGPERRGSGKKNSKRYRRIRRSLFCPRITPIIWYVKAWMPGFADI